MTTLSWPLYEARKALSESPFSAIRDLVVEESNQGLVLSGRVESFYQKQMAQETVRAACHDIELCNSVKVTRRR